MFRYNSSCEWRPGRVFFVDYPLCTDGRPLYKIGVNDNDDGYWGEWYTHSKLKAAARFYALGDHVDLAVMAEETEPYESYF